VSISLGLNAWEIRKEKEATPTSRQLTVLVVPHVVFAAPIDHEVIAVHHKLRAVIMIKCPHTVVSIEHKIIRVQVKRLDDTAPF